MAIATFYRRIKHNPHFYQSIEEIIKGEELSWQEFLETLEMELDHYEADNKYSIEELELMPEEQLLGLYYYVGHLEDKCGK